LGGIGLGYFGKDVTIEAAAGFALLFAGIGWMARLMRSFSSDFRRAQVANLLGELEVSHIRAIPVELKGEVIGRGVPGIFWSKDLVMQDESGFVNLIYRQPLGFLETLFGMFSAGKMVGKRGVFRGWYRRGPVPYVELRRAEFEDGTHSTCHQMTFLWVLAIIVTVAGALLAFGSM
jgi:hypothetical protein